MNIFYTAHSLIKFKNTNGDEMNTLSAYCSKYPNGANGFHLQTIREDGSVSTDTTESFQVSMLRCANIVKESKKTGAGIGISFNPPHSLEYNETEQCLVSCIPLPDELQDEFQDYVNECLQ